MSSEHPAPGPAEPMPAGWTVVDVYGVRLQVPDGWEVQQPDSGDPAAQILAPVLAEAPFRPNVVVRISAGATPDLTALSSWSLAGMAGMWEGQGTVVSQDIVRLGGLVARAQRFLAHMGGLEFRVERILVDRPDSIVELTVTLPIAAVASHAEALDRIVYQADYSGPLVPAPGTPATPTDLPHPAQDRALSAVSGLPLEDTRALVADQAGSFSLDGPAVSAEALRLLQDTPGETIGRLAAEAGAGPVAELESAGLLSGRTLTELATRLLEPHRDQIETLRLTAGLGPAGTHFHAWLGADGTALIAAGPPVSDLVRGESPLPEEHLHTLARVENQSLPRFASAWLGLGPLWRADLSDVRITTGELGRATEAGLAGALHTSSAVAERLTEAPLLQVTVDNGQRDSSFTLVHIPGVGYFQPAPAEPVGTDGLGQTTPLQLATATPREIVDVLIGLVSRAVGTAAGTASGSPTR